MKTTMTEKQAIIGDFLQPDFMEPYLTSGDMAALGIGFSSIQGGKRALK